MNQQKNNLIIMGMLFSLLIIPASVFAAQSGGGYIVFDQVNSSPGASAGNNFNNNSGGSPISLKSMSGGGFTLIGGAYRNVAVTPPLAPPVPPPPLLPPPAPALSGGGGLGIVPLNNNANVAITNNSLLPQVPNNLALVSNNIVTPQSQNANNNLGTASVSTALQQQPALFDVVSLPLEPKNQNSALLLVVGFAFVAGIVIGTLLLLGIRRLRKARIKKAISQMKQEDDINPHTLDNEDSQKQ